MNLAVKLKHSKSSLVSIHYVIVNQYSCLLLELQKCNWIYPFSSDLMAPNDKLVEVGWEFIKDLTTNAYQIQQQLLQEILTQNLHTEYLDKFLNGNSEKKLFKQKVPIISYDDIKPYMDRIAAGEPSGIILAEPLI
ncbi:hypothetical protein PTKIN_Ptkin14bG0198400 [Pterospermum kingtungense]